MSCGFLLLSPTLILLLPSLLSAGLIVTPVFDTSITGDPNHAVIEQTINTAISFYEATFSNPVDILINFSETNSGLGESNFNLYSVNYSDYYNALLSHSTSASDAAALATLSPGPANPVNGNTLINIKPATALALGLAGGASGCRPPNIPCISGGAVSFNAGITDPPLDSASNAYSLLAVSEHEIDEILGLGSTLGLTGPGIDTSQPSPEDLFRYDQNGNRSFTTSPWAVAWFSINGTDLARFNQDSSGDYGDWASGSIPQVQDAFGTLGSTPFLTTASPEVKALDVIGYTLSSATPEPATYLLLGGGLLLMVLTTPRQSRGN